MSSEGSCSWSEVGLLVQSKQFKVVVCGVKCVCKMSVSR